MLPIYIPRAAGLVSPKQPENNIFYKNTSALRGYGMDMKESTTELSATGTVMNLCHLNRLPKKKVISKQCNQPVYSQPTSNSQTTVKAAEITAVISSPAK